MSVWVGIQWVSNDTYTPSGRMLPDVTGIYKNTHQCECTLRVHVDLVAIEYEFHTHGGEASDPNPRPTTFSPQMWAQAQDNLT